MGRAGLVGMFRTGVHQGYAQTGASRTNIRCIRDTCAACGSVSPSHRFVCFKSCGTKTCSWPLCVGVDVPMGCPTCSRWGTDLHEQSGVKGIP